MITSLKWFRQITAAGLLSLVIASATSAAAPIAAINTAHGLAIMPCGTVVAGATDHQHLFGTSPNSMLGNDKLPGCTGMLGCGLSARLPGRVAVTTRQMWVSAAYWPVTNWLNGLSIKPELGLPHCDPIEQRVSRRDCSTVRYLAGGAVPLSGSRLRAKVYHRDPTASRMPRESGSENGSLKNEYYHVGGSRRIRHGNRSYRSCGKSAIPE